MPCERRPTLVVLGVLLASIPDLAAAHTPIEGIGDFYNGLLHPLLVPAHLLSIAAVGLLIGQQPSQSLQPAALACLAATATGLIGAGLGLTIELESLLLACAAGCGLLVAWRPRLPQGATILLGGLIGLAVGLDSPPNLVDLQTKVAALLGTGVAVYLLFLYSTAAADRLNARPWQQIAVRVLGSWIAASALLVLSLSLSGALSPV